MRRLMYWTHLVVVVAGLAAAGALSPASVGAEDSDLLMASTISPAVTCQALPNVQDFATIPDAPTQITSTSVVAAGSGHPEYCDVLGYIAPQIHFELKLPTQTWQGRYLQQGCGGYCGAVPNTTFPTCDLQPGGDFAVAADDEGHEGSGGLWALDDQQLRIDYGYRSEHVMALAGKAIVTAFYGTKPQHSYFSGCSDGGREALSEAERYPDDFDGIVAGAPEIIAGPLNAEFQSWEARVNYDAAGNPILTTAKLPTLHQAVLDACDGLDGLIDGQISDPRVCHFNPGTLRCPNGTDQPTCLTPAQIQVVRKIYSGPVDEQGQRLYPGGEPYGSELAWSPWIVAPPGSSPIAASLADGYLRFQAFGIGTLGPSYKEWTFTAEGFNSLRPVEGIYNAMSSDLSAFRDRGGKLLMWQGWADQAIPPFGTTAYYDALQDRFGGLKKVQQFARLFMFPSMYHCAGGYGPDLFDTIDPIVHWVELGQAPQKIIATQTDTGQASGNVIRTRPVFAYPDRAVYVGSGSIDDAANFTSVTPSPLPKDDIKWLGNDLFDQPPEGR